MTDRQADVLIEAIKNLGTSLTASTKHYTLTGADDWTMVVTLASCFGALLLILMGWNFTLVRLIWKGVEKKFDELNGTIADGLKELKNDHMTGLRELKKDNQREHDTIFGELRDLDEKHDNDIASVYDRMERCQDKCCE